MSEDKKLWLRTVFGMNLGNRMIARAEEIEKEQKALGYDYKELTNGDVAIGVADMKPHLLDELGQKADEEIPAKAVRRLLERVNDAVLKLAARVEKLEARLEMEASGDLVAQAAGKGAGAKAGVDKTFWSVAQHQHEARFGADEKADKAAARSSEHPLDAKYREGNEAAQALEGHSPKDLMTARRLLDQEKQEAERAAQAAKVAAALAAIKAAAS